MADALNSDSATRGFCGPCARGDHIHCTDWSRSYLTPDCQCSCAELDPDYEHLEDVGF
jgi:hypothetical protein